MLIIGIVKESKEKENRVAVTPDVVQRIKKLGYQPKDVTNIIITHLHIDHAGGLADFKNASDAFERIIKVGIFSFFKLVHM